MIFCFPYTPFYSALSKTIFVFNIEEWQNYINFSGTLLVLAPHPFTQLHKTSSKTSFTTTTEISHCDNLALSSYQQHQQVTNSFNQANLTKMDDSVTEDNNYKIPHSINSENERGHFDEPEIALQQIVPDTQNILSNPEWKQEKSNYNDEEDVQDDIDLKTREQQQPDEDNRSQSTCSTLLSLLFCLLLSFLCFVFGSSYFSQDNRCQTFGLKMDWNSGPPPT